MKVSETDFRYMVECLERDVATFLVEEDGMTIHQALDALYMSETYQKLNNPATGLYFQSPVYVHSCLVEELLKESISGKQQEIRDNSRAIGGD